MSFFKNRSGSSLFRIFNLKGYFKYLANKGKSDTKPSERVTNKMSVKYTVKGDDKQ